MATDRFRQTYRELSDVEKSRIEAIKTRASEIIEMLEVGSNDARCKAIAITDLEQSIMWAVKAITASPAKGL